MSTSQPSGKALAICFLAKLESSQINNGSDTVSLPDLFKNQGPAAAIPGPTFIHFPAGLPQHGKIRAGPIREMAPRPLLFNGLSL
ncbi:MAG: hypothetical protein ACE5GZ_03190 [Gammaproteobacteria bacterium]